MSNRTLQKVYEISLLPVSVDPTPYEQAMEHAARLEAEVWNAAERVGDIRSEIPDSAVPFLVWEYGLEPVLPYVPDMRQALVDGRLWQHERGTDAGILRALSWVDATPDLIERHSDDAWWDMFQLALGQPVSREQYETIVALTRLSKEAHADVIRVYSGWDERSFDWNRSDFNGRDLYNDWSGVWLDPTLPKMSFGRATVSLVEGIGTGDAVKAARSTSRVYYALEDEGFTFNRDDINGDRLVNLPGRGGAGVRERTGQMSVVDMAELGAWPLGAWDEAVTWQVATLQAVGRMDREGSS